MLNKQPRNLGDLTQKKVFSYSCSMSSRSTMAEETQRLISWITICYHRYYTMPEWTMHWSLQLLLRGTWGAQLAKDLPSAKVMIPESWDRTVSGSMLDGESVCPSLSTPPPAWALSLSNKINLKKKKSFLILLDKNYWKNAQFIKFLEILEYLWTKLTYITATSYQTFFF